MRRSAGVWRRAAGVRRRVELGPVSRGAVLAVVAVMAVLPAAVVAAPPVPVAQHLVGGADLLELDGVAALPVRMVLLGEPEVGCLDVFRGGPRRHAQHVIETGLSRDQAASPAAVTDSGWGKQIRTLQQPPTTQLPAYAQRWSEHNTLTD